MNIVLIGFCSSGKSSTAYEIAQRLNMKFVDLDKEIEVRYYLHYGQELHYRNIIRKEGPELFFQIENEFLMELTRFTDCVVAPGGGCPLREKNRKILSQLGKLIYLKTDPEVAFGRMKAKGIPLFLRSDPSMENVKRIWRERHDIYLSLTDCVIDNSFLTITETADRVIDILRDEGMIASAPGSS